MSIAVLSWAFAHSEAKLGDRLVLFALADHAKDDGTYAWPSVSTIARAARLSERQVQRCLRNLEEMGEIELTGRSRAGTNIYSVIGFVRAQGGDNLSPPEATGGDIHDTGGVTSTTSGGDVGVTRSVSTTTVRTTPVLPPLSPRKRGAVPTDRSREILALWNEIAGQHLRAVQWLRKIEARCKTFPELGIADHERVIRAAFAKPWWKGAATPNVVYGTDAQFERSLLAVDQQTHRTKTEADARERIARVLARRAA